MYLHDKKQVTAFILMLSPPSSPVVFLQINCILPYFSKRSRAQLKDTVSASMKNWHMRSE